MDDLDLKLKLANKALQFREAKAWEYWKKRNPNLSDEELEYKVEEYMNRHPEANLVIDSILDEALR